jgi:hypothetical protein
MAAMVEPVFTAKVVPLPTSPPTTPAAATATATTTASTASHVTDRRKRKVTQHFSNGHFSLAHE